MMPTGRREGTSLTEILVALAILALCVVPVIEFYARVGEAPAVSEDKVYAEVLATRILERWGSLPYDDLEALAGQRKDGVVDALFEDDRKDDWFGAIPEYKTDLGLSRKYFTGSLLVRKVDEGLLALDATIRWRLDGRLAADRDYSYALVKFVARADLGVAYVKGEPEL